MENPYAAPRNEDLAPEPSPPKRVPFGWIVLPLGWCLALFLLLPAIQLPTDTAPGLRDWLTRLFLSVPSALAAYRLVQFGRSSVWRLCLAIPVGIVLAFLVAVLWLSR
jgi:hypothetical protein